MWSKHQTCQIVHRNPKPSSLSLSRRAAAAATEARRRTESVGEVEDEDESAARAGFPLCFAPREDDAGVRIGRGGTKTKGSLDPKYQNR